MALIKCDECGKEYSDNATSCPNCGNPTKKIIEKEIVTPQYEQPKEPIKATDKKSLISGILSAVSAVFGFVYIVKMSLDGLALIYILLLIASSICLAVYNFKKGKNSGTILFAALCSLIFGTCLKTIQIGLNNGDIGFLIKYVVLTLSGIILLYKTYKEEHKLGKATNIGLLCVAAYALYSFFSINIGILNTTVWKIFLLEESTYAVALFLTNYSKENTNKKIEEILNKFPKMSVLLIIFIIIAVICFIIGAARLNTKTSSNISSNYIDNIDSDDDDDDYEGTFDEKDDEPEVEKIIINSSSKTVTSTYNDEPIEAEISFDEAFITSKVVPPSPTQSYYRYYEAEEGMKYLVVSLNVKNLGADTLNTDYVFSNFLGDYCDLEATLDGKYKYSGFVVGVDKDNSGKYDLDSYYYMKALETSKLYILFKISEEVSDKSASINVCFGDTNLIIDTSNTSAGV